MGERNVRKTAVMEWERSDWRLFTGGPRDVNTSKTSRRSKLRAVRPDGSAHLKANAPALSVTMRCRVDDQAVTNRLWASTGVLTRRTLKLRSQRVIAGCFTVRKRA